MTSITIKQLGLADYQQTFEAMRAHNRATTESTADEIWLLEHPPVFTQGLAGKPEHILDPGGIPVVKIDRGGQVTYHGPGQLVVYLLLNMRNKPFGVKALVRRIEQSIIDLLAEYGLTSERREGMPGVYIAPPLPRPLPRGWGGETKPLSLDGREVGERVDLLGGTKMETAKIAAIGLRVANHATYHGLSVNVNMDTEPFSRINPCGFEGLATAQLTDFGVRDNVKTVGEKLTAHLKANLYG